MKTEFWATGKLNLTYLESGISDYSSRIQKYIPFTYREIFPGRSRNQEEQLNNELKSIQKKLKPEDSVILLDQKGKHFTSPAFARYLQSLFNNVRSRLIFLSGGPYGFHPHLREIAFDMLSLSPLTYPHELIRLVFLEQLYRGLTIIHNESYHH